MLNLKITAIRGYSFKEKKLLMKLKKEFKKNNFQFYYKVKINLGDIALEQREFKDALHYFKK
jgi:hypothetical protein